MVRLSRRAVFKGLGAVVAGGVAFINACTPGSDSDDSDSDGSDQTDSTDDTEIPVPSWCDVQSPGQGPGWSAVPLAAHPQLNEVGGSTNIILDGQRMNVVHVEDGCFVAMGTVCTHEGCAVEVRTGARFVCPCHGALYNWEGLPIAGPAPDPLPTWPAGRDGDTIWVKTGE